jgi:hypothetical protein
MTVAERAPRTSTTVVLGNATTRMIPQRLLNGLCKDEDDESTDHCEEARYSSFSKDKELAAPKADEAGQICCETSRGLESCCVYLPRGETHGIGQ